jgi:FkbM family methyltransferase
VKRIDALCGTDLSRAQQLATRTAGLVASGPERARVIAAGLLFGAGWRRPITLKLDGPRGRVPFTIPDYAAFKVLDEMFFRGEYDVSLSEPPSTIIDLGGHVGVSALFFRRRWPASRILVVEPSPKLFGLLVDNVGPLDVETRHAALSATSGPVEFVEGDASWTGTTRSSPDGRVPGVTLDELLGEPVDLLKLDVEGAEFDAVPAARNLHNAAVIVGEGHAPPGSSRSRDLLARLEGFAIESSGGKVHTLFTARRAA